MNNLLDDQQQRDFFDKSVNNPKCWWRKCRSLHSAAKELFKIYSNDLSELEKKGSGEHDAPESAFFYDQVLLLEGFAIECLLKGLYVADGNKISENGKIKSLTKKQHSLIELCDINNVELGDREKNIIKNLSLIIISYGRYPSPMVYSLNPIIYTKETGYSPNYVSSWDDLVLIDNLIISIIGE